MGRRKAVMIAAISTIVGITALFWIAELMTKAVRDSDAPLSRDEVAQLAQTLGLNFPADMTSLNVWVLDDHESVSIAMRVEWALAEAHAAEGEVLRWVPGAAMASGTLTGKPYGSPKWFDPEPVRAGDLAFRRVDEKGQVSTGPRSLPNVYGVLRVSSSQRVLYLDCTADRGCFPASLWQSLTLYQKSFDGVVLGPMQGRVGCVTV